MGKNYTIVFYITNHGFGHASRNVPIIQEILKNNKSNVVYVKSDQTRCDFIRRNLSEYDDQIWYICDCHEVGLILKKGIMEPDVDLIKETVIADIKKWDSYIKREKIFMLNIKPDLVVSDIVCWAIGAAKEIGLKTLLIGNFTWSQMYQSFFEEEIWGAYKRYYQLADKTLWYEIHDKSLEDYCDDSTCISLISRRVNYNKANLIKKNHTNPIVFISNGASADIAEEINVETLPYDFIITRGLNLIGKNVTILSLDMVNTPDYIAAADYVIAKGGWSTVAEILLQKKKCALLFRGNNLEDQNTREILESRQQCVSIEAKDLYNMDEVINSIERLLPFSYDIYHDDTVIVYKTIMNMCNENNKEG